MVRNDILKNAERIINGSREETYGTPEDSFTRIAKFWSAYLDKDITNTDVANMMCLFKLARIMGKYKFDSYVDLAGYAAIAGELGMAQFKASCPDADFKNVMGDVVEN